MTIDAPPQSSPPVERLRESLTAVCSLGLLLGIGAGLGLGQLRGVGLVSGSQSDLLSVVTGLLSAILTVTGVVLSVLVVAQQLASQQYSPRAIRTALRDRSTRVALSGLFGYIGLLVGALMSLDEGDGGSVAVSAGVIGSGAALGLVVLLIQRVTDGLRSDRLVRRIAVDALDAVERIGAREDDRAQEAAGGGGSGRPLSEEDVPPDAHVLRASWTGYLQEVDLDALTDALVDAGALLLLEVPMGGFVATGVRIGWTWPAEVDVDAVRDALDRTLRVGAARTTEREIGSDLQQLVDIAIRALSPAINDPRTAVEAVDAATLVLQGLADRAEHPVLAQDGDRVVATIPRMLAWDGVAAVVDQVRPVAATFPTVIDALLLLLRGVAAMRMELDRALAHLDHLQAQVDAADLIEVDRARTTRKIDDARDAILSREGAG